MSSPPSFRITRIVGLVVGVLMIIVLGWLARLEHGGPPHSNMILTGGVPATIYLPGPGNPFFNLFAAPPAQRPAAVVLIHGFMCDRMMMSTLARRIAQNGYAVMAIDVQGHGENRNPMTGGEYVSGQLRDDVQRAVDFVRTNRLVDGSRLVVMGHSMGAGAALDFATHDPNVTASVMISGGWELGPVRPKNALFIFAERDPEEGIQQTSTALAGHLAGADPVALGQIYGDFNQGTAVEAVRVPGVDHAQIIYSAEAATTIIKWLDRTFSTARTNDLDLDDPRVAIAGVALLVFAVLLVPLGRLCGSIAPSWPERSGGWHGAVCLLLVIAVLVLAVPLVAIVPPATFTSLIVGDVQFSWYAVAGVLLILGIGLSTGFDTRRAHEQLSRTVFAAAIAFAVIYVCQVAMSVTFHRLSLTPERLVATVIGTSLVLPFWVSFELLIRRGSIPLSTTLALIGRLMILVVLGVAASVQMLPFVLLLVLPSLAILAVLIEIFAASAYSTSRNLALIALVDALWLAWSIGATNPITFML